MNKKIRFYTIILSIVFVIASVPSTAQDQQGALKPESANEARLNRLQPPELVMDAIGVKPGMAVAEIGAGRGRYVVQLAVRVGKNGRVYGEDISKSSLDHLQKRCQRWGLDQVETILGEVDDPKLPAGELDLIFIISAYHHFDDPVTLLKNARPSLKPNGTLAIAEWVKKEGERGEGTSAETMEKQMNAAGYTLDRIETFLQKNRMNIYIFKKNIK